MGGFFRVTGAPSLLPATCSGSIQAPGSLEGVRDIPILPRPARMSRERGAPCCPFPAPKICPGFFSTPGDPSHPGEERRTDKWFQGWFVYSELVGEVASLATEALSAHEQTIESQTAEMPPRQTKYGHMQPPVERLASLVSPRVGAYPGPPLGRITDQCRAPGSRPRYPARREGAAPRTRPSSVWVPHSRVFRRPQPGFGPQVLD